jgi:putative NADH-flavin reductase
MVNGAGNAMPGTGRLKNSRGGQGLVAKEYGVTIAVIGATGNTGRAVVKALRALRQNPVCVVRNADKAREVLGGDAKIAIAELPTARRWRRRWQAFKPCSWSPGTIPAWSEQQNNVLDAALKAGAQYLVRVGGSCPMAKADSEIDGRPRPCRH